MLFMALKSILGNLIFRMGILELMNILSETIISMDNLLRPDQIIGHFTLHFRVFVMDDVLNNVEYLIIHLV